MIGNNLARIYLFRKESMKYTSLNWHHHAIKSSAVLTIIVDDLAS